MKAIWSVICVIAALGVAACQVKIQPDPTSRAFYDAVQSGDMARLRTLGAPELFTPEADRQLAMLRGILPKEAPKSVTGLGRRSLKMLNSGETLETTDVYEFGQRKAVVFARMHRGTAAAPWRVQGFNVRIFSAADVAANDFKLGDKSAGHFAFLAAVVVSLLLMVAALVRVLRRKGLRRKWLWGIASFVGVGSFQMNWTTGAVAWNWLTVQLIGAGVMTSAPGLSPWMLTFTLPLGALLILSGVWANPARAKAAKQVQVAASTAFD